MRIQKLVIDNLGPFRNYSVPFPKEHNACALLTGKNNEGKSSIIQALKLLHAAARVIGKNRQRIVIERDVYYKLLQQDTEDLMIRRMVHNYGDVTAKIRGIYTDNFAINVYLDPSENIVYANHEGRVPSDVETIFGFIPPLGPLSENEDILVKESYLRASLNTSLAPRHLRNHLLKLLSDDEFELVRQIIRGSWEDIELLDYEANYAENRVNCYYREQRVDREISWAGQGLQVWFQIVTHLVRLRSCQVLILDEPEINLHPEKQNDLLRIVRENFVGAVIIATHSVELMNNVSVSHIINVQKKTSGPRIKSASDRAYLELVRSQIGSNFNLVASQFEDCDVIVFTEDTFDFRLIRDLAESHGIEVRAFNVPIHGFSEYVKASAYQAAYKMLIGRDVKYTMLLDRDYYPGEYLNEVQAKLRAQGIEAHFTNGKEIENIFLAPSLLKRLIPADLWDKFQREIERRFEEERLESVGSFLTLHKQFLPNKVDMKTVATKYLPAFEKRWNDQHGRFDVISGKAGLSFVREFVQRELGKNLSTKHLTKELAALDLPHVKELLSCLFRP